MEYKPFRNVIKREKCKRCTYSKCMYLVNEKRSYQEQKLYVVKVPICKCCGFENFANSKHLIYSFSDPKVANLKINVNKLIHNHDHDKIMTYNEFDEDKLICHHYEDEYCSKCDKHMELKTHELYSRGHPCIHITAAINKKNNQTILNQNNSK